jgi:plastocyanin
MEETTFYVLGVVLVVIALIVSVIGLRSERFPPSRLALGAGVGLLVAVVAATTTSAVILAREEQRHRNEEAAHEEQETATEAEEEGESPKQLEDQGAEGAAPAETGALSLEADAGGDLAFDTDTLDASAGEVTIALDNPAALEHDVAIERDGEEVAKSDLVSEGTTEVTADLEPGEYVFYCSVPGHREGGMEGTLTVE